jgi:hypothetical protein
LSVKDGIDFWGEGWWDLVGANEEICEQVSSLFYTAKFQGFGVAVGINIGESATAKGSPKLSPDTVVLIGDGVNTGEIASDFKYVNANPMLTEVRDMIDWAIASIQKLKGLTPEQYQTEVNKVAGIAKSIDNSEIEEIRKSKTNTCRMFEADLYEVTKVVYNHHNPGNKISESAEFSIKFVEPKIFESEQDKKTRREFGLSKGSLSIIDIIKEENPGMTDEEAQKKFESNIAQKRMMEDEFGLSDEANLNKIAANNNPKQPTAESKNLKIEEEL